MSINHLLLRCSIVLLIQFCILSLSAQYNSNSSITSAYLHEDIVAANHENLESIDSAKYEILISNSFIVPNSSGGGDNAPIEIIFINDVLNGDLEIIKSPIANDIIELIEASPNQFEIADMPPIVIESTNAICGQDGSVKISISPWTDGNDIYQWENYGIKDANGSIILFQPTIEHTIEIGSLEPGKYSVFVTYQDHAVEQPIEINEHPPVEAQFTVSSNSIAQGAYTYFENKTVGNDLSYTWNFGDGTILTDEEQPEHLYNDPGTYKVSLTVSSNSCSDTYSSYVTVEEDVSTDLKELMEEEIHIYGYGKRIIVVFDKIDNDPYDVEILDMAGKRLMAPETLNPSNNKHEIDLSGLLKGVYIVSVYNKSNRVHKRVIISD